ncbi:MAG: PilZ domain-containing protein [Deltaproteobacteria bacterium]|nr:PilZ domain-containing protein [Deltaproteobacteria bacterium]
MFLSLPEQQFKKEDPLSFHFEFAEGSLTRMVGNGVVRWTRRGAIDGLSPGCGVEFTYLDDASRALFVRMIAGTKARPFIPKG